MMKKNARQYISRWCNVWRRIFYLQNNWDIFAELLMVSFCIGCSDGTEEGIRAMTQKIEKTGIYRT